MLKNSSGYDRNKHSIAQSFYVSPKNGMYVTEIGLYFKAKDTDSTTAFPVHLELRPMVNGYPSGDFVVPNSKVTVPASAITATDDASNMHAFIFPEPVYLNGQKDYAFVLTTPSSAYKVFLSEGGEFKLGTDKTKRVKKNPVLGSLFYSQNSVTFSASQGQDIAFKMKRARFLQSGAEARLNNASVPKKLLGSAPLTSTSGSNIVHVHHPFHGLQANDVVISGAVATGGISAANLNGTRTITEVDANGYKFTAGAAASSSAIGGGDSVQSTQNYKYCVIYPSIQTLEPAGTGVLANAKGTKTKSLAGAETAYQLDGDFTIVKNQINNFTPTLRAVFDSDLEKSQMSENKSLQFRMDMWTQDSYVAPIIDMQRASVTLTGFHIDRQDFDSDSSGIYAAPGSFNSSFNYIPETNALGGSNISTHITREVELQSDAVGLKVLLAAKRPPNSDFMIFYRTCTGDELLGDIDWTHITEETNNSPDTALGRFREYRYLIGGKGGDLLAFSKFQLKICMRAVDEAKVPTFKDLRVIALGV